MRRSGELEQRLVEWAHEYGGGSTENLDYPSKSWLHQVMTYHGPAPKILRAPATRGRTPADEVEQAVRELERQTDGYAPGRCLRVEYYCAKYPLQVKLSSLRAIGAPVSRTRYFDLLWVARTHVAAWLHLGAAVEMPVA